LKRKKRKEEGPSPCFQILIEGAEEDDEEEVGEEGET